MDLGGNEEVEILRFKEDLLRCGLSSMNLIGKEAVEIEAFKSKRKMLQTGEKNRSINK